MISKILVLVVVGWCILKIIRHYQKSLNDASLSRPPEPEDMVQCNKCGVHHPKGESVVVNQQYFCCELHSQSAQ